ncbi:hypothetical protein SLS53_005448 [Cytospora paraplurivora]|uniref:Uncharacterized protein n=1 Tax=Cytospora paraplurivora TaxID=2898453 RepID=A0AAN9YEB6_9PEZI
MSVRNLRAMFESRKQESPPDRGRSPGESSSIGRDRESEGFRSSGSRRPEPIGETSEGQVAPDIAQSEAGTGSEGVNEGGNKDPAGGSASRGTSGGAEVTKVVNGVDKTKATKPAAGAARKTANAQPVKPSTPASQPKPAGKPSETAARRSTTPNAERKTAEKRPTKKLASTNVSPEAFAKPRSKSSTRPARIPASLTSHTAASGSRSRATSGNGPPSAHANTGRPTSRTSTTSGTANKGVRRSASAAGRQRPSIGPPPKLPAKDHPVPKKESKVDESFLARMTRPTQSYANKVNDKVPITPPRRSASATRKPASAKSGTSRKPTSRATSAAPSAAASPENDRKVDYSAAKNISPVVEHTPPTAEDSFTKKAESGGPSTNKEKGAIPEPPKTPERQPTILEEKEEAEALHPDAVPAVASAAPRLPEEPDVEEADVPLADGEHK